MSASAVAHPARCLRLDADGVVELVRQAERELREAEVVPVFSESPPWFTMGSGGYSTPRGS